MKISLTLNALLLLSLTALLQATPVLTLAPSSGAITGTAGSTVGWGFTLTNSTDFAVVTSSNFCLGTSGVTSLCQAPDIGTYADDIASSFTIVGPMPETPVVTQAFNAGTGVGSFTISAGAAIGAADLGQLVVTYDLYSADPNAPAFDPTTDLISAGNFLEDTASVTVFRNSSISPEPSSGMLLAVLGGTLVVWSRVRARK